MSTVLDVALALLLVSASVLILGTYIDSDDREVDVHEPDRTAETISAATISVEYSVESAEPDFHDDLDEGERNFDRVAHGPAAALLADAAVTNAAIDGEKVLVYGEDFEDAVDASIQSALIGSNHRFYATATWIPYENASIRGQSTAGRRPPDDQNIATTTMTVSSGIDPVDTEAMAEAYYDEYVDDLDEDAALEAASAEVAAAIVDAQFDDEGSQHALESLGADRQLKVYQFEQFGDAVGVEFDPDDGDLGRNEADARAAKERLVEALAAQIAADLRGEPIADELASVDDEEPDPNEWQEAYEAILDDEFSTDEVTITIQTWEP